LRIAVIAEIAPGESRVALAPDAIGKLSGFEVAVQSGAGQRAYFDDAAYKEAGALVCAGTEQALQGADLVLRVQPPSPGEVQELPRGATVISTGRPSAEVVAALASQGCTYFSLDLLPRISRAQSMDSLSSQASVAGYKAVLLAASRLPKFFPMLMTAAGTIPPAKVLVMGAGVAGLQAIATAKRLGAQVSAYDVRPAVKEEVASLGAKFVELELESAEGEGGYAAEQSEEFQRRLQELIASVVAASDVVVTTASIPGKPAPRLVTRSMVEAMRPGSVIVDLAAASGGNCEVTQPDAEVVVNGVLVIGASNLPSTMATHASQLLSRNFVNVVIAGSKDGAFAPDMDDEVFASMCIVKDGEPTGRLSS